jgi:hypothetical protein
MLIESRLQGAALASGRLSRCDSAALSIPFNLCYRPALAFSPPTTQTQHKTTTTQLSLLSTLLCICVFLAAKTSRRAIPFTSSRRPVPPFAQLSVFRQVLEIFRYSSASRWIFPILQLLRIFMLLRWVSFLRRFLPSLHHQRRNVPFKRQPCTTSLSSPRRFLFLANSLELAIMSMHSPPRTVVRKFVLKL